MVRVINEQEFMKLIKSNTEADSSRPLVVDCFTDWCPPCKASAPVYEKLSQKYQTEADFVKINVDHNPGVAARLQVRGVPTFVIIKGNKLISRVVGADMRKLEKYIKSAIN
ncbi:MAG: thioredoxin family protein [Candidatus Hodarchaeota archaeon]